jgi:hypothetical protein
VIQGSFLTSVCRDRAGLIFDNIKCGVGNPEIFIAREIEKVVEKFGGVMSGSAFKDRMKVGLIGYDPCSIQALIDTNCFLTKCWDAEATEEHEVTWDSSDCEKRMRILPELDELLPMVFSQKINPQKRLSILKEYEGRLLLANAAVHKQAWVSMDAYLGIGALVYPFAMIGTSTFIGSAATVGIHSSVLANASVGIGSCIGPNATVCEGARIGQGVSVGAGAVVGEGVFVGDGMKISPGQIVKFNVGEKRV